MFRMCLHNSCGVEIVASCTANADAMLSMLHMSRCVVLLHARATRCSLHMMQRLYWAYASGCEKLGNSMLCSAWQQVVSSRNWWTRARWVQCVYAYTWWVRLVTRYSWQPLAKHIRDPALDHTVLCCTLFWHVWPRWCAKCSFRIRMFGVSLFSYAIWFRRVHKCFATS